MQSINVEIPEQHQVLIDQLIVCSVCMSVVTLGDGLVILGVHCVQRVQHVQHVPWHDDSGLDILGSGQHNPLIICRVQSTAAHCTAPYHLLIMPTPARPRRHGEHTKLASTAQTCASLISCPTKDCPQSMSSRYCLCNSRQSCCHK